MVKTVTVEGKEYKVTDFQAKTQGIYKNIVEHVPVSIVNVAMDEEKTKIISLLICSYQHDKVELEVDGVPVTLDLSSGIEFYRVGDQLAFDIITFPI